jgi:hypothetical protein
MASGATSADEAQIIVDINIKAACCARGNTRKMGGSHGAPCVEYDRKHVSLISPPCRAWSLTNGLSVRRVTAPYTWHAGNIIQSLGQCDIDCLSRLQKVDSQVTVRAKYQMCTGNAPKSIQPSHVDTKLHVRMAARERISCWSSLLASTSLLPVSEMVLFEHGQRTAERDRRLDEPIASTDRAV